MFDSCFLSQLFLGKDSLNGPSNKWTLLKGNDSGFLSISFPVSQETSRNREITKEEIFILI